MTDDYDLPSVLSELCDIARKAGAAAMRYYDTATRVTKADHSPVTDADHAANDVILAGLDFNFPDYAVLSEESADTEQRLSNRCVWIVDPLDGTEEFLARNGEFSVMIGLALNGRAVAGVVYLPTEGLMYFAAEEEGAWVEQGGIRQALVASPAPDPSSLRLIRSRSHAESRVMHLADKLGITDVMPCGSVGVKCGRVADGRRDLYLHPVSYLREWDTCVPEAILRLAGGTVTDCRGEPLRYNQPEPRHAHGMMACAPGVFEAVMPVWKPIYESRG